MKRALVVLGIVLGTPTACVLISRIGKPGRVQVTPWFRLEHQWALIDIPHVFRLGQDDVTAAMDVGGKWTTARPGRVYALAGGSSVLVDTYPPALYVRGRADEIPLPKPCATDEGSAPHTIVVPQGAAHFYCYRRNTPEGHVMMTDIASDGRVLRSGIITLKGFETCIDLRRANATSAGVPLLFVNDCEGRCAILELTWPESREISYGNLPRDCTFLKGWEQHTKELGIYDEARAWH